MRHRFALSSVAKCITTLPTGRFGILTWWPFPELCSNVAAMSAEVGGSTDSVDTNVASQAGTQGAANAGAGATSTPASAEGAAVPKLELEGVSVGGVNPDGSVEEVGEQPEHLLEDAKESKDRGNACFGESNWKSAALEYHSACLLLNRISSDHPDASDETKAAAKALMVCGTPPCERMRRPCSLRSDCVACA